MRGRSARLATAGPLETSRAATMNVAKILARENVRFASAATSKKHALELLSEVLAPAAGDVTARAVLEGLTARERLGSTALGDAVAMPHTRTEGVKRSVGAFLRLGKGVAFDAPDGVPVSLLFGLLMPIDCGDNELREFKELIARLRDPVLQGRLRETDNPDELYALLTDSLTAAYRKLEV